MVKRRLGLPRLQLSDSVLVGPLCHKLDPRLPKQICQPCPVCSAASLAPLPCRHVQGCTTQLAEQPGVGEGFNSPVHYINNILFYLTWTWQAWPPFCSVTLLLNNVVDPVVVSLLMHRALMPQEKNLQNLPHAAELGAGLRKG